MSAAVPKVLKKKEGRYFHANKRSEIHEMKEELHSHDKHKQKDAIKRVIASMTLGKDVSSLFPDMVQCMQSNQMEIKKLVYLYVLNYAKTQPELAVLAVNTFMKDAGDPNPLIRALALRTMGCIRLDQICEYLLEPLRRCCRDQDPYVRKTAAICVSKVWEINPEVVEDQGFIEVLRDMTGDRNPVVVANAVASLLELSESKEDPSVLGMNSRMVEKLLSALNECTEWGQVMLLDGIALYEPNGSQDAEGVIERVTARLSHANPAVVMAAMRVIMSDLDKVTENADFVKQVVKKLHPPLVSLLSNPPEIQYVAIRNLNLIVQRYPQVMNSDVKVFFCRYTDPVYLKVEKVDMMVRLCTPKNAEQVLSEFKEYAADVDIDFSRKAVRAIGRVAVEVDGVARMAMPVLLELIEMKVNHVVQEAVVVVADILRKYHIEYEKAISALCDNLESLDQPEAKASMIWILGEYAEHIENVDTVLNTFMEFFADEPVSVQLQLLTAIVKLFLKCPGIGEPMVTQVLQMCTEYSDNPDLRDRGYLYWRLLSTDPELAKQIVLCDKPEVWSPVESSYMRQYHRQLLKKLCDETGLMSSVFYLPAEEFITRMRVHDTDDYTGDDYQQDLLQGDDRTQAQPRGISEEDGSSSADAYTRPTPGPTTFDLLDL
ncbi:AP-2 complex subunit beta-1, putative [Perkinsus marinus ATCC 50983]|uniref:AP complex subunit beta n=1 Tax=Perkinsus marinus (strain ATCC 50983 / TXsc) TaxID=423536 RepID=C5K7D6_PERM5|nr:AP-2 complex subunit beta-1, putative [Perkinsus marinus ATCC 50983]EER19471.1 AP-2 complex subunit beta-1, putative [Perkinsus marinus ATCC 50983]|eukprot:XP_002787675.1 AP-2 complex subunit beta-1, putative [Perkinsus marinus ATCC 50983]